MWPCSKTMRPVRLVDRRWRRRDLRAWSVRHGLSGMVCATECRKTLF
ncbi:Hypothetical protein RY70_469 [Bifidobacterium bifidum]|nr:Hypothetical protein RY70_469 [Bifidobacterium bifidum]